MFAEVGSGKTLMSLFRAYESGARKVIVICPASVRDTKVWELDLRKSGLHFDEFQVEGYYFLQKFKQIDFNKYSDYYLIIDEAHKVKNSQSLQGQGAFKLTQIVRDFSLLSGTPMSKWADAVNYAKITGLVRNKTEFYRRFVIEQPSYVHKGKDIVGYRDVDTLTAWWNSIALRGRSEEFVELPKKQVIDINIPFKRTDYLRMIKNKITPTGEPITNRPQMNWALRNFAETVPEKLNWIVEKVEGLDNCLIFATTIDAIKLLSEKLTKANIDHGLWYGARKDDYNGKKVMIVQYTSGGTGLNLQKFNTTIFMSPCYSFIDYTQAVGRTYRNGQESKCTFYQIRASNSIDAKIYASLSEKRDFDNGLGVSYDDWVKEIGG